MITISPENHQYPWTIAVAQQSVFGIIISLIFFSKKVASSFFKVAILVLVSNLCFAWIYFLVLWKCNETFTLTR
jgi:hypothetical protein